MDLEGVLSRAEILLHLDGPAPKHVVGFENGPAVQADVGEGVQPMEDEFHHFLFQELRADIERRPVNPVLLPDPLKDQLPVPPEGVGDEAVGQQVRVDRAGYGGREPVGKIVDQVRR